MTYPVDLQPASDIPAPVPDTTLVQWVTSTLKAHVPAGEVTLRLVNPDEMIYLNHTYRAQNKPTNVLAFPASIPKNIVLDCPFIGDVIICPAVLAAESTEQHKPLASHWAHIVVHGVLHLLGFDHQNEDDTRRMQTEEIRLLAQWEIDNPYLNEEHLPRD